MAQYFEGIGRRKTSTARVRIMSGSGSFVINEKELETYFPTERDNKTVTEPLDVLETSRSNYDISVLVKGGGVIGQAGSVRLVFIPGCEGKRKEKTGSQRRAESSYLYKTLTLLAAVIPQLEEIGKTNTRRTPVRLKGSPLFISFRD